MSSIEGVIKIQFNALPEVIAPKARRKVGAVHMGSLSLIEFLGRLKEGLHRTKIRNRMVYLVVSPVAIKKKKRRTILEGLNNESSRIRSFE